MAKGLVKQTIKLLQSFLGGIFAVVLIGIFGRLLRGDDDE